MKLKVLGSSSHGNCYILETDTDDLILDCGVRYRDILRGIHFYLTSVRGCLVTHEHQDHAREIKEIIKAGIDVYTSKGTISSLNIGYPIDLFTHRINIVRAGEQFTIGDFIILPFDVQHDATEPLGFLIQYKPTGEKLLFATDTYYLKYRFKAINYLILECNYCLDILKANIEAETIPTALKNRLLESHFSLDNVKGFLKANDLSQVRKIILIHLSEGNSDAKRMVREIEELTGKETVVALPGIDIPLDLYPF